MATDSALAPEQAANLPTTPIVTTERFVIRPLADSDADALAVAANDPAIVHYMRNSFPYPYSVEIAKSFIGMANAQSPVVDFCICLHDGTYVGGVGLKPGTDNEYRGWEIGYWIRKDCWGRGLATAAVKAFSAWVFATFPDVLRLEGRVVQGNDGSMLVLERAGYTREGTRRQAVFKHGKAFDNTIFGLLRSECEGEGAKE